jgi:uncharacterized iron-regulated membrane protein
MKLRPVLSWLHLYGGLVVGLFLTVQAITGVMLTFVEELVTLERPELHVVPTGQPQAALDTVVAEVQRSRPGYVIDRIYTPNGALQLNAFWLFGRERGADGQLALAHLHLHPDTGVVVGGPYARPPLGVFLYSIHNSLLLGPPGKVVITVVGVALALSALSGLILWFPARNVTRKLGSFNLGNTGAKRWFRLHSLIGFWLCLPLLIISLTGVIELQHDWVPTAMPHIDNAAVLKAVAAHQESCEKPSFAAAEAAALRFIDQPGTAVKMVEPPRGQRAPWWRVLARTPGDANLGAGSAMVYLSARCLQPLASELPMRADSGAWLVAAAKSIHSGRLFGAVGEALSLLAGLALLAIPVTGTMIWWQRRTARHLLERRAVDESRPSSATR